MIQRITVYFRFPNDKSVCSLRKTRLLTINKIEEVRISFIELSFIGKHHALRNSNM